MLARRTFLMLPLLAAVPRVALAAARPEMRVLRNPGCGCCEVWAAIMKDAGFPLTIADHDDLDGRKAALGIPADLHGCHTTQVAGFVVEGHVPLPAIEQLLREWPDAIGIAVPGMPMGSPGMGGTPEVYDVTLFTATGRRPYGRYQGSLAVKA